MADEFMKGFAALTGGLLIWMTFASWYNTPSFYGTQLIGANPSNPDQYTLLALYVKDAMLTLGVLGALTFWVIIPAGRRARSYRASN